MTHIVGIYVVDLDSAAQKDPRAVKSVGGKYENTICSFMHNFWNLNPGIWENDMKLSHVQHKLVKTDEIMAEAAIVSECRITICPCGHVGQEYVALESIEAGKYSENRVLKTPNCGYKNEAPLHILV